MADSPADKLAARLAGKRTARVRTPLGQLIYAHGFTLRDVQVGSRVSAASVCRMLQGKSPSLASARKLARFFGCSIDDLFPEPRP